MKILSEKVTGDFSPAFDVVTREVELENQGVITRHIVRHKPVVSILVVDNLTMPKHSSFYMGEEYRSGVNEYRIGNAAGYIDDGETPIEAAERELKEELGLISREPLVSLGVMSSSEGFTDEEVHMFAALGHFIKVPTEFDEGEFVKLREFSRQEVEKRIADGKIRSAPTIISFLKYTALADKGEI